MSIVRVGEGAVAEGIDDPGSQQALLMFDVLLLGQLYLFSQYLLVLAVIVLFLFKHFLLVLFGLLLANDNLALQFYSLLLLLGQHRRQPLLKEIYVLLERFDFGVLPDSARLEALVLLSLLFH